MRDSLKFEYERILQVVDVDILQIKNSLFLQFPNMQVSF